MPADGVSLAGVRIFQSKVEQMKKAIIFPAVALGLAGLAQAGGQASQKSAVFVMTNAASQNEILSFQRQSDGSLKPYGTFRTDGRGSGGTTDPLGSQGSLTLSEDHALLFAVNTGSGEISSFRVDGPRLELRDVKPSGGSAPVAVAEHGGLVYVLNFAGNSSVVGFKVDDGRLHHIPGSVRYLTTANSGASSLAFSPDGHYLLATEKLTSNIDVFPVQADGTLGTLVATKDTSAGLFAVLFAPGGAALSLEAGAGSVTSFWIEPTGTLTTLAAPVPTMGMASCWHAITPNGHFLYTSNAGSGNVSGFAISGTGTVTALPGTIVASYPAGSTNLDVAISGDSKYVYTLNSGTGSIGMLAIQSDGTLKVIGTLPTLTPASGANGIAAL
jgi:6-phosphogluconolactonase (cycloisomerase 2 family)